MCALSLTSSGVGVCKHSTRLRNMPTSFKPLRNISFGIKSPDVCQPRASSRTHVHVQLSESHSVRCVQNPIFIFHYAAAAADDLRARFMPIHHSSTPFRQSQICAALPSLLVCMIFMTTANKTVCGGVGAKVCVANCHITLLASSGTSSKITCNV